MRRSVVYAFLGVGGLVVILAVSLASVGTEMDQLRIEREDVKMEVEYFQQAVGELTNEKTALEQQVEEQHATIEDQRKTIEQWRIELERLRNSQTSHEVVSPSPESEPVAP